MRTANNNLTVEALVAKYRNYVKDNVSIQGDPLIDKQYGKYADHQLLITLYKIVSGQNADEYILDGLSAYDKAFKKRVLSKEEMAFLSNNFKKVVDYIFSDMLYGMNDYVWQAMTSLRADDALLAIIRKIAKASDGDTVYIEEDIMGDIALLFPQCTIILADDAYNSLGLNPKEDIKRTREENALKMIRFFAYGIQSKVPKNLNDEKMDVVIRDLPGLYRRAPKSLTVSSSLKPDGQMIIVHTSDFLLGNDFLPIRERAISSGEIEALIRYDLERYITVAENKKHTSICMQDELTGTEKKVPYDQIDNEVLLPMYYLSEKHASWVALSTLVDTPEIPRIDAAGVHKGVSPENKVLLQKELGISFKDANISNKNLYSLSDLTENTAPWGGMDFMGWYTNSLPCIYLWGFEKQYRIGYVDEAKENKKYAIPYQMATLIPKEGVDIRYIAALLFSPEVKRQIEAIYCGQDVVSNMPIILRHIFVPNHNDLERATFLGEANYSAMEDLADDQKKAHEAYVKSIRLRKHALTQSLTSIESLFYALNKYRIKNGGVLHDEDVISRVKGTTVEAAFNFLSKSIEDMMPALEHIAEIEYSFAKPEWIDPEKFIEGYISKYENGWLNFKPVITWIKGQNQAEKELANPEAGDVVLRKGEPITQFFFPKDALERIFRNIISNAIAHGFDETKLKDYLIRFSWHTDGVSLIITIENNGSAIPEDRDTSSLFEYGVSTKLHQDGHNGIGCNEIADIIHRYDGEVEIVSTPDEEFKVKYILTFNRFVTKKTN